MSPPTTRSAAKMTTNADLANTLADILTAVQNNNADTAANTANINALAVISANLAVSLNNRNTVNLPIDLSTTFDGSSNTTIAREWLRTWKSNISLHTLSDESALQIARRTLTGAAKSWIIRKWDELKTINAFEESFRKSFLPEVDSVELTRLMLERDQRVGEDVMNYIHDKVMLLEPLKLQLRDVRKYIARGCRWSAMASHLLSVPANDVDELISEARIFVNCHPPSPKPNRSTAAINNPPTSNQIAAKVQPSRFTTPTNSTAVSAPITKTAESKGTERPAATAEKPTCYNCFKQGHVSKYCTEPRRIPKCTACNQMGHVRSKCPTAAPATESSDTRTANTPSTAMSVTETEPPPNDTFVTEASLQKYQRTVLIGDTPVNAQIDPGSCDCLITATCAIQSRLNFQPSAKVFRGLGAAADTKAIGTATVPVQIDGITIEVPVHIVPDNTLPVPLLIGRPWTDHPSIVYARIGQHFRFLEVGEFTARQLADMVKNIRNDDVCSTETTEAEGTVMRIQNVECISTSTELWQPFTLSELNINEELDPAHRQCFLDLANKYRHAFATNLTEIGCTDLVTMEITENPGSTPRAQPPYRTTAEQSKKLDELVAEYEEANIVTPCNSPYAAPALLVDKKTNEKRMVIDYRRMNDQTVDIQFPMPYADDILVQLQPAEYYVLLDLYSGYLQVKMSPTSSDKTAFVIPSGQFKFLRMPPGLKNAPAIFQSLMNKILRRLPRGIALCYMDDIIIFAATLKELLRRLELVLTALLAAGLTCRVSKCEFGKTKIEYLGFEIEHGQIRPGTRKTRTIAEFPQPRDEHEVRRFLGLTGFFRRFVKNYAIIAAPLSALLKKGAQYIWTNAQTNAFETLKQKLTTSPVLHLFDNTAPTEIHTDASAIGIAGMLIQNGHLVYAVSKHCTAAESTYHSSRLELLAIVWTISRLRQFLLGIRFVIYTDCQCLLYLNKAKVGNGQLARWAVLLSEYNCEFRHRPGTAMAHVDAISRAPAPNAEPTESIEEEIMSQSSSVVLVVNAVDKIRTFQAEDDEIKNLIRLVNSNGGRDPEYVVEDGLLYRKTPDGGKLFVLPKCMRKAMAIKFHDLMGHYSVEKVIAAISARYWFAGMRQYIRTHIRRCFSCATVKGPSGKTAGHLQPIPPAEVPFHTVHVDHLGPLVTSSQGYRHVMVVVDSCTRYVELYASDSTTAAEVVERFEKFALRFGYPRHIVSDRGTAFTAAAFEQWCADHGIQHTLVSTRHPRGNGLVERVNRVIVPQISIYAQQPDNSDWPQHLPLIRRNINAAVNRSLGKSPFEMLYGFQPNFVDAEMAAIQPPQSRPEPQAVRQEARINLINSQSDMKRTFDRRHCVGETLDVGQIVFAKDAASDKLSPKFRGPLVVVKRIATDTYRCQSLNTEGVILDTNFHISALRLLPLKQLAAGRA